jgi:adenylate cyclase
MRATDSIAGIDAFVNGKNVQFSAVFARIEARLFLMKKGKFDNRPVLIAALAGIIVGALAFANLFSGSDRMFHDLFYFGGKPQPDIVIVAIDDSSLQNVGKWPWDRPTMAKLVGALAPAKIVGLNVNFPNPGDTAADAGLAAAIQQNGKTVLPIDVSYLADGKTVSSTTAPIPLIAAAAVSLAHTSVTPDVDGVVRRLPLTITAVDGNTDHAFGEIVARRAGARPPTLPLDAGGKILVPFVGGPGKFRMVSAADVLSGAVPSESFRDQIVLVGGTAATFRDQYRVPTSGAALMSGIEIQATFVNAMLTGKFLSELPAGYTALICLLLALAIGFAIPLLRVRIGLIAAVGLVAAYFIATVIAALAGLFLPFTLPLLAIALAYGGVNVYRFVMVNRERQELRSAFEKYVAPSVINSVMAHPENLMLGGERRRMTVLFSDLRGFTSLSERLDPSQVVTILNGYLNEMTDIVFDEHGVLDKYMGDAVMAFWGAPIDDQHHAERAIRTAIRMRDRLVELNRAAYFGPNIGLRMGVGISTGDLIVGNMGSHRHFDYTVIGDTVNTGSRIESLTKHYGVEILATEEVVKGLPKDYVVRQLDKVMVKGKQEPVRLYEIVGFGQHMTPEVHDKLERFARALALYEADDFHGASYAFADILALYANDEPSRLFWERSNKFMENPPPPDWKGVWVMQGK